ncbi:MAG TPA: hypothetical protein HPQ00_07940 [Magnetococcales bacterium]|nr:hypothetical protein [Magnetococcales bacterium]
MASDRTAASLLLVHGYASDPEVWRKSGIVGVLETNGWHPGGKFLVGADGKFRFDAAFGDSVRRYYLADLPSEAPIRHQGEILDTLVSALVRQRPQAVVFAAGHSAGGVALRLAMVWRSSLGIRGLITIAAPHRGTDTAKLASFITQTPMAMMTPFVGMGTLNRSQNLYADLAPEEEGNFLFWLNRAKHPRAFYLSIVRESGGLLAMDPVVSSASQDLTQVQALGKLAQSITSGTGHALETNDGELMAEYLARWIKGL